jgi:hypothetical protein
VTAADDLLSIAERMTEIKARFVNVGGSLTAADDDGVAFEGLLTEAKALLWDFKDLPSDYRTKLSNIEIGMKFNVHGGPSYNDVGNAIAAIEAASRHLSRTRTFREDRASERVTLTPYVNDARLNQLRQLRSQSHDFGRLIRLCEELNIANENDCHMSIAMLVRTIIQHVPPVFSKRNFDEVTTEYGGSSLRESLAILNNTSRTIANQHLHTTIRRTEILPNATQVDFRAHLDVLLGEIVRRTTEGE